MALILNIDTATEFASVSLAIQGESIGLLKNQEIRDHASWIHSAIHQLLEQHSRDLSELDAVAVTEGPGSYTGLRVGMATAKGLCYVLNIPLVVENTLRVMARAAYLQESNLRDLLVPMIDARRMEVFTAVYDNTFAEVMPPIAQVLNPTSFDGLGVAGRFLCFGSGSQKFQSMADPDRFRFVDLVHDAGSLAYLSFLKFRENDFADLAYVEPLYLKEFYSPAKK